MARRDRWTIDFESVREMATPWPKTPAYMAGRNEAHNLSSRISRLVNDFKNNPGNKAPRNGDMAYHMLAYRYGYNSAASAPAKKVSDQAFTGGLFSDVYESKEMLDRYDSAELRANKSMVEGGKAFYALIASQSDDLARRHALLGFKETAQEVHFNIYGAYPRDKRPLAILPLSEVKKDKRPPAPTRTVIPKASSGASSSSDVGGEDDPFGESSPATSGYSSEITPQVTSTEEPFEQFDLPPPSVSGIPFQQDIIRHFFNFQQVVRQQNPSLAPTFFDMFHQKSIETAKQSKLKISDVVSKIIQMEAVQFYKLARDGIFALISGYGAGEAHHALLQTTLNQISSLTTLDREEIARVPPRLRPVLYQFGYMGAFDQLFSSWKTNSELTVSIQDLYDADTATLFRKLRKNLVVVGIIKAKSGRTYPSDEAVKADPSYPGFEYFIEAGIVSAINFFKSFVENKSESATQSEQMTYQLWASTFGVFCLGWHVYMTHKDLRATDHVESIKRKLKLEQDVLSYTPSYDANWQQQYEATDKKQLFRMKIPRDVMNKNIGDRNAVVFITRLDPDYAYYSKVNQEHNTSLDLMAKYIARRFGVNSSTGVAPLRGPEYLTVGWQTRAIQMFQVMPITSQMLRSATGGTETYVMNVLTHLDSEAGLDYRTFYTDLGEFALTFSDQAYKKLFTMHGSELPSIQVLQQAFSNRMRYAVIIEHQVNTWLSYNRSMFDPIDATDVWNTGKMFWSFEGHPIQGENILSEIVASAYTRKINEERDKFLRKRKFLLQYGTIELPYIEKDYALLIEVLTMAYMLTASLSDEDGEFLSKIHTMVKKGNYDDQDEIQVKIDDVMNRFWLQRKSNYVYPWLPAETQANLSNQLANIVITDEDRKFFRSFFVSSAITRLSLGDITSQIEDTDIFRHVLVTVYLAEMFVNCNAFASEITNRNWEKVITFADVHANRHLFEPSSKKSQQENYDDMFTYFIMIQESKGELSAPAAQSTSDDVPFSEETVTQEDEGGDEEENEPASVPLRSAPEPEESPASKKTRPSSSASSSSQRPSSFFEPAFSSMRGKWYSLMFEAEQLVQADVIVGPDRHIYSDGVYLGMNFSQDLAAFVNSAYPRDSTLREKYTNVRAYAINQLSSIYNELEQQKIAAAIIDADFNNPVSQKHEVEVVRKLLAITQPVATRIFKFEGKKDVYMLGFVNGYEQKTAEVEASFPEIEEPEGGNRKVAQISAAISQMNPNEGTLADLVNQLEKEKNQPLVAGAVSAGRNAGNAFVEGVLQYAKQNNLSYQSALSRSYIDLENYHDKLTGKQSIALFVQTGAFVKIAARDILQYPNDKVSFIQGFLLAMDRINSMTDDSRVIISYFNDYDEDFNPDAARPDVDDIVAALLNAQRVSELHLEGVGFSNSEFEAIIRGVRDTATINSISLKNTSVSTIEDAFNAFPNLRGFTSINNPITATEFMTVFELPSTRVHLTSLNVETHPFDTEKLTEFLQVFNTFFENSNVLRDVELEFNLSTRSFATDNKLAISYLYNGLMKSSSIQTFYCQGVYPFRHDTIHQDAISKHLKKNRGVSVSSRYPHSSVSPAKAREILHHGSVHGHPLTKAQRGFFGARSRE